MIAAILLAAGESTRMGRPKALLPWHDTTLVEYQVRELTAAGVERIAVVLGHDAGEVWPHVPDEAHMVVNEAYREGRASSLRAGAAALPDDADPILVYDDEETMLIRMAKRVYDMDLDDAQFSWRRMKISEIGDNLFRQEYPATAEEAVRSHRGLVLPGLSSCVIEKVPFLYSEIPFDERVGGFDYGYSDPTALVSGVYKDQKLYVIRTYRASGKLAKGYAGEVMDGHTYFCDPANPGPRDELAEAVRSGGVRGCSFLQAPRASGTGERSIVKQEWDIVRRWVVEGRILIVRGEHEQLCAEADTLEWNEKTGEPDKTRTTECGHFDTIDALRYLVMGLARTGKMIAPRRRVVPSRRQQLRSV
ncbi:MAG: NTP transferase domain-containing protein [Chloroflexi bacterium]|nr:NTP transferase domain-containing protein [Chloroflexota bacterium]